MHSAVLAFRVSPTFLKCMHGGQKVAKPQFSSQTQAGQCAPIKYLLLIDHQSHVKTKICIVLQILPPSFPQLRFQKVVMYRICKH